MTSLEERRKRFGKRWRRKNLVRKLLKRTQVVLVMMQMAVMLMQVVLVNDHDADDHDVGVGYDANRGGASGINDDKSG